MTDIAAPAPSTGAESSVSETPSHEGHEHDTERDESDDSDSASSASRSSKPGSSDKPKKESEKSDKAPEKSAKEKAEEEVKKEIRKLKLKRGDKEYELTEEEVIRRAQLADQAEEKFQSAAQTRKQLENFVQALKSDPFSVLEQLGLGDQIDSLAESRLTSKVQKELMSPEERELAELREYKQRQEDARLKAEQEQMTRAQQEQMKQLQQRAAQHYDQKITEVLSQSDLPRSPYAVKMVANLLHSALEKGYELPIETAVEMAREQYVSAIQSMTASMGPEQLLKFFGDDIAKKIRKYDVERIKAKRQAPVTPAEQVEQDLKQQSAPRRDSRKFLKPDEWSEMIRKKAGL